MKLLFDQNLSPELVQRLADVFPESAHVSTLGLDRSSDAQVWLFAREKDFTIVTQDADYGEMSAIGGFPPRVVWIRLGNSSTQDIETLLRTHRDAIESMKGDSGAGLLVLL